MPWYEERKHVMASEAAAHRQTHEMIEMTSCAMSIPLDEVWHKRWCTLPSDCTKLYKRIYEFEVKHDDLFVVTFPRSGTTMLQEICWLLLNGLDYDFAKDVQLTLRSVFLELSALYKAMKVNTVTMANNIRSPRIIKSHLPAHLLPYQIWKKNTNIVYCARNPKDVVTSYYHFHKGLGTWRGTMDEFIDDFLNNDIMYTPYWPHVLDFAQMRYEPHIFFTTFEEMKRDLPRVVQNLCIFLERPKLNQDEMQKLLEHCSFESMKANKRTNPTEPIRHGYGSPSVLPEFQFMRRGIIGDYKEEISAENQEKLDSWTKAAFDKYDVPLSSVFFNV